MILCPSCGTANAADQKFCVSCGQSLPAGSLSITSISPTVIGSAESKSGRLRAYRAVDLGNLLATKNKVTIGRSSDCDICLPHPNVSRYHAMLLRRSDGRLELHDLKSINGVYVAGLRLSEPHLVEERERVGIGPFLMALDKELLYLLDSSRSLRLEARGMERTVTLNSGGTRKLLDNINLVVEPGEFVTFLGPSGSGKSTLMDALNGRRRATGGQVLANGEDFYRHFDSFRQSLGYVPQRDIVHTQLTVYQALAYTARLRLPNDTSAGEIQDRIAEVLREMELEDHQKTTIANLSGGQIKRVSLGAELLARPSLLYIDEATSGLDAGTDAKMMHLFRRLSGEGRSIVCITHNVENVDSCHLILVLHSGRAVFYGPPLEALRFFEVRRVSEVYDRLTGKPAETWEKRFQDSDLYDQYVRKRLEVELPAEAESPSAVQQIAALGTELKTLMTHFAGEILRLPAERLQGKASEAADKKPHTPEAVVDKNRARAVPRPPRPPLWRQFRILTERYFELLVSDRRTLLLLILQAPIVALFILVGFANKPFQEMMLAPRKLEPEERTALELLDQVSESLKVYRDLTDQEKQALQQVQIQIQNGEKIDGSQIMEMLQRLHKARLTKKILDMPVPSMPDRQIINPRYSYMLMFVLAITVIWFGCNNASKEIVKEQAIYARERAVNLSIFPYLGSKFLILSLLTALHTFLLMIIIYGGLALLHVVFQMQMPDPSQRLGYLGQYGILTLLGVTGVALGLLVSACVSSPDRASTLLPYVIIPQIILGGGIMPVGTFPLQTLAWLGSPVYWAYRGIIRGMLELPEEWRMDTYTHEGVLLPCVMLAAQTTILLILTVWALKAKDAA